MSEQYHFDFSDWKEAFAMYYRKRCGLAVQVNCENYKVQGNPNIVFVVSKAHGSEGYWVEEKGQNAKSDKDTKVYRSIASVNQLELDVISSQNGRRVKPRPAFQPPENCPECLVGVPFDENHRHVKGASLTGNTDTLD